MKTNANGLALIRQWEGCKLTAYKDVVGVWTVGFGHTSMAGPPKVTPGLKLTQAEADDLLVMDLIRYEVAVLRALKRDPSDNQFSAMVSLCYNIGENAFAASSVVKHFNAGDTAKAANAFLMWRKARNPKTGNLEVVQGLLNRRQAEMALFLKPSAAVAAKPPKHAAEPPMLDFPAQPDPTGFLAVLDAIIKAIVAIFSKKGT